MAAERRKHGPEDRMAAFVADARLGNAADAAREVGIAERTVRRWLKDDAYQAERKAAEKQVHEEALRFRLTPARRGWPAGLRGLELLEELARDDSLETKDRVRAAEALVRAAAEMSRAVPIEWDAEQRRATRVEFVVVGAEDEQGGAGRAERRRPGPRAARARA